MNGSSPLRIVVLGRGRMGQSVKEVAESRGHEVIGPWGREEVAAVDWPDVDVAIDFTTPEAATGVFRACRERNLPLVSGTTGWLHDREAVEQAVKAAGHPMLWAPNFSVGIHLFRKALAEVQETLAESAWSIHVEEVHHTGKMDAPSGTALAIGEDLEGRGAPVVPIHAQRLPGCRVPTKWCGKTKWTASPSPTPPRTGPGSPKAQCSAPNGWLFKPRRLTRFTAWKTFGGDIAAPSLSSCRFPSSCSCFFR